jgi:hypothetical protein
MTIMTVPRDPRDTPLSVWRTRTGFRVQAASWRDWGGWVKTAGFTFFLVKGLLWLLAPAVLYMMG